MSDNTPDAALRALAELFVAPARTRTVRQVTTVHEDGTRTIRRYSDSGRPRDAQRSKLYRAEQMCVGWQAGRRFDTVDDVQAYVNRILSHAYVQRHFVKAKYGIEVRPGHGMRRGHAYRYAMALPKFARHEMYILHEMAHCLADRFDEESHGWKFCDRYLKLVTHVMGREAGDSLKASFRERKVKFREPKKRAPLSPERRAQAAESLKKARAARAAKKMLDNQ